MSERLETPFDSKFYGDLLKGRQATLSHRQRLSMYEILEDSAGRMLKSLQIDRMLLDHEGGADKATMERLGFGIHEYAEIVAYARAGTNYMKQLMKEQEEASSHGEDCDCPLCDEFEMEPEGEAGKE